MAPLWKTSRYPSIAMECTPGLSHPRTKRVGIPLLISSSLLNTLRCLAPSYGHLDLSGLKTLRSFSGKMHDARSICGALESLPDSVKLEKATIHIIPWGMRAIFPNQVPCRVMEEELWSSIAALPCLRDCTLTIRVHRKI